MKQSELKEWVKTFACAVVGLLWFWLFVYLVFSLPVWELGIDL
jgi:hypothetical protein